MADEILHEGKFLRFVRRSGWEFAQRRNASAVVAIVAVTRERELVLVEQFRAPLGCDVLELPAGLVGDECASEALLDAAARELEEETGFRSSALSVLGAGPPSAGVSDEVLTLVLARDCVRVSAGGGVGDEAIRVHVLALGDAARWLDERRSAGMMIDAKVYAGLWFAERARA